MKRVVSVSLGSKKRDKTSQATICGVDFEISRVGTNGSMQKAAEMIAELDGEVSAIGLGGMDRYLWVDDVRYAFRDVDRLARIATKTPVVDGSGVKNTLERKTIEYLHENGIVDFAGSKVLVLCGVDRFGMAQQIAKMSDEVVFGDLMFNCNVPVPLRSYNKLRIIAKTFLPIVTRLPFTWVYPTGEKQDVTVPKYGEFFQWADVIAGDFNIFKRAMPEPEKGYLDGKPLISNTVTAEDVAELAKRNMSVLSTATPEYDGRYYATNVFEGMLVTLMEKQPEEVSEEDYDALLKEMDWHPTVTYLTDTHEITSEKRGRVDAQ